MPRQREPIRIVLGEPDELIRAALAALLESEPGMVVVGLAADGRAALALTLAHEPDILLLETYLPTLDPVELISRLREQSPCVRPVILTESHEPALILQLLRVGAQGYVFKDDQPAMLFQALRCVHRGSEWLSPQVVELLMAQAAGNSQQGVDSLTRRERKVLSLLASGQRDGEIAQGLTIAQPTVRRHVHSIFRKLGVQTRVEAALVAFEAGFVSLPGTKATTGHRPQWQG